MPSALQIIDDGAWDAFALEHGAHLLQTSAWGALKSRFGWRAERWGRLENGQVCAGTQVLFRRLLPGLELAYVPRGPVVADAPFLSALSETVGRRGDFMFKLEPNWLAGDSRTELVRHSGFAPSVETIQPAATIRLDLTGELDSILAGMKPKWRYNIRLSEKKGVAVREGTMADLTAFFELSRVTAERDHFAIHGLNYYQSAFELLVGRDMARLLVAEYEGQALAMIFVTFVGHEAIYLYGASGNEHRNVMPNHGLHWAAIQLAKARGCTQYDLWGVPATAQEGDEHLPGSLYQFKQGFGGKVVHYAGAFDRVARRLPHTLYRFARRVRKSGLG